MYAERLKDFVTKKYKKSLSERGIDGKSRRLVVSRARDKSSYLQNHTMRRSGPRLECGAATPRGLS